MSLRDFFARNKETTSTHVVNGVICDTAELKDLITKWTQNEGRKFKDFATFVELVGVKTPVKLSEWNEKEHSFKCVTALNTEVTISFFFGDWIDFGSEIHVTEGEETRRFVVNSNSTKGKTVPKVTLRSRTITRNGKELNSYYCEFFCNRTLILDATHKLNVEINEPNGGSYDKPDAAVLKNYQQVEEYLLGLDNSLVVAQVYDKVIELLGFSDEDISNSPKISISYIETVDKEERTRSKILMKNGKIQEYAVLKNGETFHVFRDGGWKYLSDDGIRIVYLAEKKHHIFSVTGTEEKIINANPSEIMKRAKSKISELWKFEK